jgi:hypothetical protein
MPIRHVRLDHFRHGAAAIQSQNGRDESVKS